MALEGRAGVARPGEAGASVAGRRAGHRCPCPQHSGRAISAKTSDQEVGHAWTPGRLGSQRCSSQREGGLFSATEAEARERAAGFADVSGPEREGSEKELSQLCFIVNSGEGSRGKQCARERQDVSTEARVTAGFQAWGSEAGKRASGDSHTCPQPAGAGHSAPVSAGRGAQPGQATAVTGYMRPSKGLKFWRHTL